MHLSLKKCYQTESSGNLEDLCVASKLTEKGSYITKSLI